MNRRLRSRFSKVTIRFASATAAALIVTVGLTATLSGKVDRVDPASLPSSGEEVYGPFAPSDTVAARDLPATRQWPPLPPSDNGEAGPDHRVHVIDGLSGAGIAVQDKATGEVVAMFDLGRLGSGNCAFGAGDAVVLFDSQADRWLLSQSSRISSTACVYVSQTQDPAGAYFGYEFLAPGFPAQPRYSILADDYHVHGAASGRAAAYALERTPMLAGLPATARRLANPGDGTAKLGVPPGVPGFSKSFNLDTIGPGSTSVLTFEIDNSASPTSVTDLAFSDTLPAGVTIATPSSAATDCTDAILNAPDGGDTLTFSEGRIGSFQTCSVQVNVVGEAIDEVTTVHTNISGDLTSSEGNSGPAVDTLTVDITLPGFSKSFSPSSIPLGGTSTLTFTIDNTLNSADAISLSFSDVFPAGMVIATPPSASTDCGDPLIPATVTAVAGAGEVSVSAPGFGTFVALPAGETCTVSVDVTTESYGVFGNVTTELLSGSSLDVSSGFATAALDVPRNALVKSFVDDPVPPGGSVTLEFTVTNFDRNFPMTAIAFDDPIDPLGLLTGLAPGETLPKPACGGTLDFAAGTLSFSGGSLPAEGSCVISVLLDVPAAAPTGTFTNTTDPLTATVDGTGLTFNTATDELRVQPIPILTKEFTDDPVGAGGDVTLRFTIENTSGTSAATGIGFIDELTTFLPSPLSVSAPTPNPPCGVGSSFSLVGTSFGQGLQLAGGSLPPGGACTFDVTVTIPVGFPAGTYVNTTQEISATVGGETISGLPATDTLEVVAAPSLLKEFTNDPVLPGGTVNLQFTLTHDEFAPGDATAITFTDNLATVLPGLTVSLPPIPDPPCGAGSSLTASAGDTLLTFAGGSLAPGQSCSFGVTLNVPALAAAGSHANTTSNVSATVLGVTAEENPASDALVIASLRMSKEFLDDPVLPGGTVTLQFTIDNVGLQDATSIVFVDNLDVVVPGLAVIPASVPATPCGGGSSIVLLSGNKTLLLTGGSLLATETCIFSVTLQVPAAAAPGTYPNTTSSFSATIGGSTVSLSNASDELVVADSFLALTKEFTDDPVLPGDTVNLQFTLTNLDAAQAASDLAFTDDLGAALFGLEATGLPIAACGGTVSGIDTISLTAGSLVAGGSCTFDVTLQVPASATPGSVATNTTSSVTGTIGGLGVTGDPATDQLTISAATLSKAFTGSTFPGGTATLTFTIDNVDPVATLSGLTFTDDLNAVIPGLVATGLPANNVCGAGSLLTGSSFLTLTGGTLLPGTSCTFDVTLAVPASASLGRFLNTTSTLRSDGNPIASEAQATLVVQPPPGAAPRMETGTVLAGATHVTVSLAYTYADPVVVATVHAVTNTSPVVARVGNVTPTSFDLRLQNPSGGTPSSDNVSYWVVERGVWNFDGIRLEADKYLSTQVSRKGAFNAESRTYGQTYATPVVLGQVMSENDPRWSSFFARGDTLSNPPSATALRTGRQIGEDTDTTRANETIGYIVIEAVHTTLAGVELEAAVGTDTVLGAVNGAPFTYNFNSPFTFAPTNAVMSIAGVDGGDGAWAQGFGIPLANSFSLFLSVDEDQIADVERSHTNEQVAYAAFSGDLLFPEPPDCLIDNDCDDGLFCNGVETCDDGACQLGTDPCSGSPCDEDNDVCIGGGTAQLESITTTAGGLAPATVVTTNTYASPVIACAVVYDNNTAPVVVRVGNVTNNSFEVSLQNPGDLTPVVADTVNCLVVEEGSWQIDGHPVEAAKYTSTITDKERGYLGAAQTLTHSFTNPVVLGQVMSRIDPLWSVYWQQGTTLGSPPSSAALRNGKMVGEDTNVIRIDEVVGYIVFEQNHGTLGGVEFEAALGPDIVRSVTNGPPFNYTFNTPFSSAPAFAVATQAGMDGGDGSWAYLYGSAFTTATQLSLAVDEDQIFNAERGHTTEQVGYVAFATPVVFPTAPCTNDSECDDGLYCNGAETCNVGAGTCQSGTPPVCGDGVGCTVDSCNEVTDSCDNTPNDGLCDNGQFCDGAETCDAFLDCQVGTDPCGGGTCDEVSDVCPGVGPVAQMEWGHVNVGGSPTTVGLSNTYLDPVVVTSLEYSNNTKPVVTRVAGVTGNSFQVFLQNPSGLTPAAEKVSYIVVEKGTWVMGGRKIEAQKYTSTKTAHDGDWSQFDAQVYGQAYTNPVVLGQVMTTNDADFSSFWSRGSARGSAPNAAVLNTGKMVAEDPDTTRANETIGFIVIERGHGFLGGVEFEAGLSTDSVASVVQAPPYTATFSTSFSSPPAVAVAVQEAMDGFNGGWMYTFGPQTTATVINLAGDEDQLSDTERGRATEQAGFCVFQTPGVFP